MKYILASFALVASASAAIAGAHSNVRWSADVELGYNDLIENGFYMSGGLNMRAKADMGDIGSIKITWGGAFSGSTLGIDWDKYPTIVIKTDWVTLSVGDRKSAADDNYNGVSGMSVNNSAVSGDESGFFDPKGNYYIVRLDASFGNIDVALSGDAPNLQAGGPLNYPSIGISGSIGAVDFGFGYDTFGAREEASVIGANVGFGIGKVSVEMAYQLDGEGDRTFGMGADGAIGAVDLAGYYAANASTANEFGVSVGTSFGPVDVGVYWDGSDGGASNAGVDLKYKVSSSFSTYAGFDQSTRYYIGAILKIDKNAKLGVSAASDSGGNDHGPKNFQDGLSTWFSVNF